MKNRINNAITFLKNELSPNAPLCAYIYDLESLTEHVSNMMSVLPKNCELYYASKANPEAQILSTLAPLVHGFEAASGGELAWLNENQPEVPLIFGGPGKLYSELEQAVLLGVEAIHVESLAELDRLEKICLHRNLSCNVLLRMNISLQGLPTTKLAMGGKPTPFGFDENELPLVLKVIENSVSINLQGFHFHLMSHQLDRIAHLGLMSLYFKTFKHWCNLYNLDVSLINVGGGIGINYLEPAKAFDWEMFCCELTQLIQGEGLEGIKIRFECGRYLTANCGFYVMQVLDIKYNHGQYFAIGHGGTHHFRTPAAQNHNHPFFVCHGKAEQSSNAYFSYLEIKQQAVTLVGQLCTPKDILSRQQYIDKLAIGDYLVFTLAGAYAWNISHQNFLMHAPPLKYFLKGN